MKKTTVVLQRSNGEELDRINGDFDEVKKDSAVLVADLFREFLDGKNQGFVVKRFDSQYALVKYNK